MAYRLYQFDSLILPFYDGDDDVSPGQLANALISLPGGGVWDGAGTDPWARRATIIKKRCTLIEDTIATQKTVFLAIRAQNGRRGRLWRLWDDGTTEWIWARLTGIEVVRDVSDIATLNIDLSFTLLTSYWYGTHHGGGWILDDGIAIDTGFLLDESDTYAVTAGANTITLTNGGNTPVLPIVTIKAGNANITYLHVTVTGVSEMYYGGTVVAGNSLVFDCGALSILNNGADAYNGFVLTVNHKQDTWLQLEPGSNTVIVTMTGGGAGTTAAFAYHDAWE